VSDESGKTTVTVRIGGEDHVLRASAEPEYTRRCAQVVDERIREVRKKLGLIEPHKAAILAALSLADELFEARKELDALRARTGARLEEVAGRLRAAAGGGRTE